MKTQSCLIIHPPYLTRASERTFEPPLGPDTIVTYLRARGFVASALDLNMRLVWAIAREHGYDPDDPGQPYFGQADYGKASGLIIAALNRRMQQELEDDSSFFFKLGVDKSTLLARAAELSTDDGDILMRAFLDNVAMDEFDVLGVSIHTESQFLAALSYALRVKRDHPHVTVIFGGAYVSQITSQLMGWPELYDAVDLCCLGEGEETMVRLLSGDAWPDVPNVSYRAADGRVRRTRQLLFKSLDVLPALRFSDYASGIYPPIDGVITIPYQTSRGCAYNKCAYCTYPIHEPGYRERSIPKVISDIQDLIEIYGAHYISFKDSLVVPSRVRELCNALNEADIKIGWKFATKIHQVFSQRPMIDLLIKSGCKKIEFGIEHVNTRIQELIDKRQPRPMIEKTLHAFAGTGIEVDMNMMFGFPTETEAEAMENFEFVQWAKQLPETSVHFSAHFVEINKRSPFHVKPTEYGIVRLDAEGIGGNCDWDRPEWRTKPVWIERLKSI